jgi:hypothetical protein
LSGGLRRSTIAAVKRLPALLLVLLAAGCGGGGGGSTGVAGGSGGDDRPIVGGEELGKTTNCLIDENWLVQPGDNNIQGTSAAGLNFELTFYPSVEDAKKHLGKKRVRVENAVFDYGFQGAQNVGVAASTAVLGTETKTIEHCLAEARR